MACINLSKLLELYVDILYLSEIAKEYLIGEDILRLLHFYSSSGKDMCKKLHLLES